MKNTDVCLITAAADEVTINRNEAALRLGVERGYSNEMIEWAQARLMSLLHYKCAYIRTKIDRSRENVVDFGFMKAESKSLYKNLNGCEEAFVLAMTCGIAVDRELAKRRISSQAEFFVLDALASAAADSFCDFAADQMQGELYCAPRFSPGYGDLSLRLQQPLLDRLDAQWLLGISLSPSYLMTPMKSITAIMGIKNEEYH